MIQEIDRERLERALTRQLASIYAERTGLFHKLASAAQLSPERDFQSRDLRAMNFMYADLRGFDFSKSDLRGTLLRWATHLDRTTILRGSRFGIADREWLSRRGIRLPPFARSALLLDIDGTLLDFAPTPEAVRVPKNLRGILRRIRDLLDGPLGVISGRPVEQIERLLGDAPYAVAGEHGGAIRHGPAEALDRPKLPRVPRGWVEEAEQQVARFPGALLELTARGFVLHYRGASDEAGPAFRQWIHGVATRRPQAFEVLDGMKAFQLRPAGADKGGAVKALMARPPFVGRLPVFIGDDVTDHDAIRMAQQMGGVGLLVADAFGGPPNVRRWLAKVANREGWD